MSEKKKQTVSRQPSEDRTADAAVQTVHGTARSEAEGRKQDIQTEVQPDTVVGSGKIQPLSQAEQEHLTYLSVYEKYNDYKKKRVTWKRGGALFIIISGLVFLTLMFSLESKIGFLVLWIITIILCVAFMIRTDYMYNEYKNMLGICDEFDMHDIESDEADKTVREKELEKKK